MSGIVEIDLHGLRAEQAKTRIDKALLAAGPAVYRLRLIHGFHGGQSLKEMIREEYGYGRCDQVLRIEPGANQGITELVLREY